MQELENTTSGSRIGKAVKVIAVIAAVYGAFVAVGRVMSKKARELEQQNIGQKVKRYLAFMNGKNIKIGNEPVEEIDIHSYMGGVELDLTNAYITQDMDIKIRSVMSGVNIKVPPMVRVILDGTNIMGGFANLVPNYEAEELPTVFVMAENVMGGIAVQMVPEAEK
ncbi:MAG: LiaF domain-containing protein [Lachnospiraceae bacterium]